MGLEACSSDHLALHSAVLPAQAVAVGGGGGQGKEEKEERLERRPPEESGKGLTAPRSWSSARPTRGKTRDIGAPLDATNKSFSAHLEIRDFRHDKRLCSVDHPCIYNSCTKEKLACDDAM